MRLVRAETLDSLDDYRIVEAPIPEPGPRAVRVRVGAVGVGYVDALTALGRYQVKPPLPFTPGNEFAGVVEAIGAEVTGVAIGDRVLAAGPAAFAEYALTAEAALAVIPDNLAFEAAAGLRVNYLTAMHGLIDRAQLAPGETLLVIGAAGGVGSAAIQVGKRLGARVVAAARTEEKRQFALSLGADAAIAHDPTDWRERIKAACDGKGPDVIFDPVCGPMLDPTFRSLVWRGRHLVVGFVGGPIPELKSNLTLMKGAALIGVDYRQFALYEPARARAYLDQVLAWIAAGDFVPPVGRVFDFEDFRAALEYGFSGTGVGKTVLRVGA